MSDPDKPKLIIDEDWKTQVERERQALRKGDETAESASPNTSGASTSSPSEPVAQSSTAPANTGSSNTGQASGGQSVDSALPPPPPASFPFLVSMLGTQALAAMGQLGEEDAPPARLDYAKHYIDLLDLLEQKTKGNLATDEYDLLADWLHQLRMTYVALAKARK